MIAVATPAEDASGLVGEAGFAQAATVLRGETPWSLVALAGYVSPEDERFGRLAESAGIDGWCYLGGFANPIILGDVS